MLVNILCEMLLLLGVIKVVEVKPVKGCIQYVNIGETVVLECHSLHSNLKKPIWRKGKLAISNGSKLNPKLVNKSKYSIVGEHENDEYFLKVHDITVDDLQNYFCDTSTENGAIEKSITLLLSRRTVNLETTMSDKDFTTEKKQKTTKLFVHTTMADIYVTKSFEIKTTDLFGLTKLKETQNITTLSVEQDIDLTTGILGEQGDETFLSGLKMYEKFVLFGMAGAGFVLLLALSITCNLCINRKCKAAEISVPTERMEQQSNQEDPQSTIQTSSYDYIDDNDLLSYTDLAQRIVSSVPNQESRAANSIVSSERSYVVPEDHPINVQLHTYQSMKEINNTEAVHHYMEIKSSKAPFVAIWTPECERTYHRNSLGDLKHIYGGIDTSCKKRAICNSWPQQFRTKCKESVVKNFSVSQIAQDSVNPEKRQNLYIGTIFCGSSLEVTTSNKNHTDIIDLVTRDGVENLDYSQVNCNGSDIAAKPVNLQICSANYCACPRIDLTDRICRLVDNPSYFSTISSPLCLNDDLHGSLKEDPNEYFGENISKKESRQYENINLE